MSRLGARRRGVAALTLLLAGAWLLHLVTSWADKSTTAIITIAFIGVIILALDWIVVALGPGLWRFISSVALSASRAVARDEEVVALVGRHPRVFDWLGRRLTTERAGGRYLTVTVAGTLYFLLEFLSIALSLTLSRAIVRFDPQILALLRAFRTPGMTRLFWIATLAADSRVLAGIALASALLLVLWGRRSEA
ncbi:MAG: hypothetical protein FDZ75_07000, partial [Actinobacteria bacterium]